MSIFARIEQNLFQIRCKAMQLPVFVRNQGVTVNDPAYWGNIEALNLMARQLEILMRELLNAQNQLGLQQRNIPRSVSGQDRSDMTYRIGQRKAEGFGLMREAQRVKDLLDDLRIKNGEIDLDEAVEKLLRTGFGTYDQLTTHKVIHDVPSWGPQISGPGFDVSPEKAVLAVFLSLHALISYVKKKRGKQAGA